MIRYFISLLLVFLVTHPIQAQSADDLSGIIEHMSSIIYPASNRNYVAVKVGGYWWAPVNLKVPVSVNMDGKKIVEQELFAYPETVDPCPEGWQLPEFVHFRSLDSLSRIGRAEFDYAHKELVFKVDRGKESLHFPANGIEDTNGQIHGKGLIGAYWSNASETRLTDFVGRFFFQGSLINNGYGDKRLKMSIRCVHK